MIDSCRCVSSDEAVESVALNEAQVVTPAPPVPVPTFIPPQRDNYEWVSNVPNEDGWTNLNIRRLRSVISQLGEDWANVAVYMNCGVTAKQCCDMWNEIKDNPEAGKMTEIEAAMFPTANGLAVDVNRFANPLVYKEWCAYEVKCLVFFLLFADNLFCRLFTLKSWW